MPVILRTNVDEWDAAAGRLLQALSDQQEVVAQAQVLPTKEAALRYLDESVYGTPAGTTYIRTEKLKRSVGVILEGAPGARSLLLVADTDYASQVELGQELPFQLQGKGLDDDPPVITQEELTDLSLTLAEDGADISVMEFGRSGRNYQAPGPFITPAAVGALYRYRDDLERAYNLILFKDALESSQRGR